LTSGHAMTKMHRLVFLEHGKFRFFRSFIFHKVV